MINISRIDLNLFVVFDAIYTEGGITRASEALKLTQPAVSHALGRLRDLVDDPLFVRKGHGMSPTPVARELIGPVRRAIGEIEGSLSQLSHFDPLTSQREFKIGMRPIVESATIPELMLQIRDAAPSIQISSVHHNRADFQTNLTTGTLAAVVDILLPLTHNIHNQRLAGGKMVVVARKDHPVVQGHISLESYLDQDHILASSRVMGPGMEDMELFRLGLQRRIKLRCQHYWTACKVVSTSNLLLTMPEHYARFANEPLANQLIPFPMEMTAHDIFLYWHASAENDQANRWLRDNIIASFQTTSRQ
jgi:DNA-binding transcriptional LysR family regulator